MFAKNYNKKDVTHIPSVGEARKNDSPYVENDSPKRFNSPALPLEHGDIHVLSMILLFGIY